ncbi:hypothetical protein P3T76_007392 [Phytophthora citrophthora]|uniref:Uncharacterized protein n=1 Tax=Phytophthora citrophthora TaxID=4793 RepID=A0AAD9LMK6_9STRA|nr:hypothetical protein P3T76_007392 [Phytophthora citrophthora]
MGEEIKNLPTNKLILIFDKGEGILQKNLPGFRSEMDGNKFGDLVKTFPLEQQGVMLSAYTKYLDAKSLLKR